MVMSVLMECILTRTNAAEQMTRFLDNILKETISDERSPALHKEHNADTKRPHVFSVALVVEGTQICTNWTNGSIW